MKNNKKRGFTIVELVIVIAVIAILAAVLIPTFSNVVENANKSACQQEARNKYVEVLAQDLEDGVQDGKKGDTDISVATAGEGKYTYTVSTGTVSFTYTSNGYTATFNGTTWTVTKVTGK